MNTHTNTPIPPPATLPAPGQSIDLDAGQVLALAQAHVAVHGGNHVDAVQDILTALKTLREAYRPEHAVLQADIEKAAFLKHIKDNIEALLKISTVIKTAESMLPSNEREHDDYHWAVLAHRNFQSISGMIGEVIFAGRRIQLDGIPLDGTALPSPQV